MTANPPHPCLALAGGAIADFLPHLASLAHLFVGPHRRAHSVWAKRRPSVLPYDETTSDLERAPDGVDVLVHLAAVVTGGEDLQCAGAVIATEPLLDAMARTSCRRIVLASSFAVYDWSASRGTLDERSPIKSVPGLYEAGRPQNRQMLARAHYPPLRGAAPLGPDRAAPGLHLGP